MGGAPNPHGKTFKVKVVSTKGNVAQFAGQDDDGNPVKITLESVYSKQISVGQTWGTDFRFLPDEPQ